MAWNNLIQISKSAATMLPIVINATHIGRHLDGIGVYSMQLLKHLAVVLSPLTFLVYLNRAAAVHFRQITWPKHIRIRWVSAALSPDFQLAGHLRRLAFANYLGLKHRHQPLFSTSQMEASFAHPRQIVTVHDLIPLHLPRQHRRQYAYFRWVLPRVLRRAVQVVAPSRHTRDQLAAHYGLSPARMQVIYHGPGIHEQLPRPVEPAARERFILFLGRLAPSKNLETLLAAFRQLSRSHGMELLVTGRGNGCPVFPNVRFTGYVSTATVHRLYRRAALFVYPSLEEGFGFPPVEAMAHGCPVVASTGGSLQEVLGEAAHYPSDASPEALAESMALLIHRRDLRTRLSRAGSLQVSRFCWQQSAQAHLNLFQQCWAR